MTNELIVLVSIGMAVIGGLTSSLVIMWRIGRWHARQEVYSRAHAKGIDDINDRLDTMNGHVRNQGERIANIEGHVK